MFIDTHTHLNFGAFVNDWKAVVDRALAAQVEKMIVVGVDLESSQRAVELASPHEALYASVGIHPHHVRAVSEASNFEIAKMFERLEILAHEPKVVAIGETGLDYHLYQNTKYEIRNTKQEWDHVKNVQKQLLGKQVELALKLQKPLILHSREAGADVLDVIEHFAKTEGVWPKGVFHCFDGNLTFLKAVLKAHFYVGFTGQITYVSDRARVAKTVPLDRLLLETDSPFMPPFAKASGGKTPRGRSEPKDVTIVAQFHALTRGITVSSVETHTTVNAQRLFSF